MAGPRQIYNLSTMNFWWFLFTIPERAHIWCLLGNNTGRDMVFLLTSYKHLQGSPVMKWKRDQKRWKWVVEGGGKSQRTVRQRMSQRTLEVLWKHMVQVQAGKWQMREVESSQGISCSFLLLPGLAWSAQPPAVQVFPTAQGCMFTCIFCSFDRLHLDTV